LPQETTSNQKRYCCHWKWWKVKTGSVATGNHVESKKVALPPETIGTGKKVSGRWTGIIKWCFQSGWPDLANFA
jgi:hypothetical protein